LWIGYGTAALLLACIYSFILLRTNWNKVAEEARNEIEERLS